MKPGHSHFDAVDDSPLNGLIGVSSAMSRVYQLTRISAQADSSVLLLGETGTGKDVIASALHGLSKRSAGPFVRIDCGALTDDQLETELFGSSENGSTENSSNDHSLKDHECGHPGQWVAAQGGTIFLDEINSTSTLFQAKLLRLLQSGNFVRTGSRETIEVDVRVIAACSLDLNLEVTEGRFREDLYWRLNVIPIAIPPLRRREGDIELLVRHFLTVFGRSLEKPIRKIDPVALKALVDYQWPGNVWELQNYIERAVVLTQSDQIEFSLFPIAVTGNAQAAQVAVFRPTDDESLIREFVYSRLSKSEDDDEDLMKQIVDPVEKELLEQVMKLCNQTRITAARKLGMNRNTLYKKLVEHDLAKPKSNDAAGG